MPDPTMDDAVQRKMFRKVAINTTVAFVGMVAPQWAGLLTDASLAFTLSTISIHVACLAAMAAAAWPFWLAYTSQTLGDGDYDVHTPRDIYNTGKAWIAAVTPSVRASTSR